jgi:two-component system, NarL family, nitrate/nitrite response regulator NarL
LGTNPIRVGVVDDHPATRAGLSLAASQDARFFEPAIVVVRACDSVDALLAGGAETLDVVVLDMSLADGSNPRDNVAKLVAAGAPVLVYTQSDNADHLRQAIRAGAVAIARKTDELRDTLALLRKVAAGEQVECQDFASAMDADTAFVMARLSARERETLKWYAAGLSGDQVARRMNIRPSTVSTNLKRIREKYATTGRPAYTKVALYQRAIEDGIIEAEQTQDTGS